MFVEGFIEIIPEGLLSLVNHGLANGFDLFDHDNIKALRFF